MTDQPSDRHPSLDHSFSIPAPDYPARVPIDIGGDLSRSVSILHAPTNSFVAQVHTTTPRAARAKTRIVEALEHEDLHRTDLQS